MNLLYLQNINYLYWIYCVLYEFMMLFFGGKHSVCWWKYENELYLLQALFQGSVHHLHSLRLWFMWGATAGFVPTQMGLLGLCEWLLLYSWVPYEWVTPENTHKHILAIRRNQVFCATGIAVALWMCVSHGAISKHVCHTVCSNHIPKVEHKDIWYYGCWFGLRFKVSEICVT